MRKGEENGSGGKALQAPQEGRRQPTGSGALSE